jgi:hypothetical protein
MRNPLQYIQDYILKIAITIRTTRNIMRNPLNPIQNHISKADMTKAVQKDVIATKALNGLP